jgi:hypothetical protein
MLFLQTQYLLIFFFIIIDVGDLIVSGETIDVIVYEDSQFIFPLSSYKQIKNF